MVDLTEACEEAVEKGFANMISENVIVFTGKIDQNKLRKVQTSLSNALHQRVKIREEKEREAARKNQGFLIY